MSNVMHAMSVGTFVPALKSFAAVLDKGEAHAKATGIDPAELASSRLAPDMFTLAQQVDIACLQARGGIAMLTGQSLPAFRASEVSFAGFRATIDETIAELSAAPLSAFEGAADRMIRAPLPDAGIALEATGLELLRDWSLPHFYFHVVTGYDILRHAGAPLGKLDYLAHVGYAIKPLA